MERSELVAAFGLRVRSALPLPGSLPLKFAETADLVIERGGASLPSAETGRWGPYRACAGALLFSKPGVARYLCTVDRILIDACPRADEGEVAAMLIATALPAVLWQRGDFVLHAGAAVLPGGSLALAFAGASGSGKSTLLCKLLRRGGSVVGDDSLRVLVDGPQCETRISGLSACLNLRSAGAALDAQRTALPVPVSQQACSARLGAIVLLQNSDYASPPIRLRGPAALQTLLVQRHRAGIPNLLGRLPATFLQAATIARSVPVYSWTTRAVSSALSSGELAMLEALLPGNP